MKDRCGFLFVHYKRCYCTELVSWEHAACPLSGIKKRPLVGGWLNTSSVAISIGATTSVRYREVVRSWEGPLWDVPLYIQTTHTHIHTHTHTHTPYTPTKLKHNWVYGWLKTSMESAPLCLTWHTLHSSSSLPSHSLMLLWVSASWATNWLMQGGQGSTILLQIWAPPTSSYRRCCLMLALPSS